MFNVNFVTQPYHNTLKLSPIKWLQKCPKVIRTSSNIFNKVPKSSKNHPKSLEAAGTFLEIPVVTR